MEFRNINTFLKVAELNNFSKAAEKLGYSQSAVTVQIQQLEKELGTRLFERIGKGVSLTEKGQAFLFYANEILHMTDKAIQDTKAPVVLNPSQITGTLRIGSIESVSTAILPDILLAFHKTCPRVKIIVQTKHRDKLIEEIHNNQIDLFFTMEEQRMFPNLKRTILCKDKVVFIAPPDPAASAGIHKSVDELSELPFIFTEKGESYRHQLDKLLWSHGIEINPVLEISNPETLLHLVQHQMGYSFLPYFSVRDSVKKGNVLPMYTDLPPVYVWCQMFYHKDKWLTPQMNAFFSLTEQYFNQNFHTD